MLLGPVFVLWCALSIAGLFLPIITVCLYLESEDSEGRSKPRQQTTELIVMKTENTAYPKREFGINLQRTLCLSSSWQKPLHHQPVPWCIREIPPGVSSCLSQENDATRRNHNKAWGLSLRISQRRSCCSHAGNHLADSNVCASDTVQWPAPLIKITHRKWLSVMQGWGKGKWVDGGESRSESESLQITLSCQRHCLMKDGGGFSVKSVDKGGALEPATGDPKWIASVVLGKSCANGYCVGMLSSSSEK